MSNLPIPFNISLLVLTDDKIQGLKPVRSLDIWDGATKQFSEDGLFSISIFGKVGDELRNRKFSYIDIKISVLYPIIYRALTKLKVFYIEILEGKSYAVWNDKEGLFEKSSPLDGETGYNFFMQYFDKLTFEARPSVQREQNISLINKFRDKARNTKIVVLPAGLRDLEIDANGKASEDEVNDYYRKLLSLSNSINDASIKHNPESLDSIRLSMQLTFNELYTHFENMLQGKKKLILGKWAARRVFNGTRNVITSMGVSGSELGSKASVGFNDTVVGLYQYVKATMPVSRFNIRNDFLTKVFFGPNAPICLVNKKTLTKEMVTLKSDYYDAWMTDEGIEKVITSFKDEYVRHEPLEIDGRYIGLIYKGPDSTYKLFQDISELPEGRKKEDVYPITFCELLYCAVYKTSNKYPAFLTRYPIAGYGSIYPCTIFLKPTVKVEKRTELNDSWEIDEHCATTFTFPTKGEFVNSMSPHSSHLKLLTADFDGDVCSLNVIYSDEAVKEVHNFLNSKQFYLDTSNKIAFSSATDTINYVVQNMTGE